MYLFFLSLFFICFPLFFCVFLFFSFFNQLFLFNHLFFLPLFYYSLWVWSTVLALLKSIGKKYSTKNIWIYGKKFNWRKLYTAEKYIYLLTPSRKADYQTLIQTISSDYPLQYCAHQWVERVEGSNESKRDVAQNC